MTVFSRLLVPFLPLLLLLDPAARCLLVGEQGDALR
jgi:hypothetical protein